MSEIIFEDDNLFSLVERGRKDPSYALSSSILPNMSLNRWSGRIVSDWFILLLISSLSLSLKLMSWKISFQTDFDVSLILLQCSPSCTRDSLIKNQTKKNKMNKKHGKQLKLSVHLDLTAYSNWFRWFCPVLNNF